ncbi:MAG: DUF2147 domain-containing protein [Devosiaceae bacterium]|nr:DUF2147 domain-containing protein [Devosiaceae bacterium]
MVSIKSITGILVGVLLTISTIGASAQSNALLQFSPAGMWQADDGDSRYDVTLCGDGTQICAKLIWINPAKVNDRNVQYLNEYVIYQGNRARPAEWRGEINIYGTKVGGSVKILGTNSLKVTGCFLAFFCESYTLQRMAETATS